MAGTTVFVPVYRTRWFPDLDVLSQDAIALRSLVVVSGSTSSRGEGLTVLTSRRIVFSTPAN
jgi:hypothetical protein